MPFWFCRLFLTHTLILLIFFQKYAAFWKLICLYRSKHLSVRMTVELGEESLLKRLLHAPVPHVTYWMRARVCKAEGNTYKNINLLLGSHRFKWKMLYTRFIGIFLKSGYTDPGSVLVFHFALFCCCRRDELAPSECTHWERREGLKPAEVKHCVTAQSLLSPWQLEHPFNCSIFLRYFM